MSRSTRRGVHTLTMHTARTRPSNMPLKVGDRQSSGECSCGDIFIADRADDVREQFNLHVAKIQATGQGTSILSVSVQITAHYSEDEDDPGFTDSIYVPLEEWEEMTESERTTYVNDMVGQRIGAEIERRENPPPEPTPEEQAEDLERNGIILQEQWHRNEAEKLRIQREALSETVDEDE